ncbi:hypothetical protein PMW03_14695 [Clostridium paraputrificum]|nr:hypothetical protein [Clostridium paraputrificum]MDB2111393.1 hypothetical protein [Clostridium paraputrificum]
MFTIKFKNILLIKFNWFIYDIKPTGTVTELVVVIVEGGRL